MYWNQFAVYTISSAERLIETWDVLKYIEAAPVMTETYGINRNMRCIEISLR